LISYPLFIFNSKNVEKEKKRYMKLVKKLFEGLRLNLKSLRSIIEDVIKLGKEALSLICTAMLSNQLKRELVSLSS